MQEDVFSRSGQRRPNAMKKYSFFEYKLEIERKWVYYVMFLILPCVMCTVLVLFSFTIPPEDGKRIGFCSSLMLAITVFLLLVAEILPEKSDTVPILGIYYTLTMMEIAFADGHHPGAKCVPFEKRATLLFQSFVYNVQRKQKVKASKS